MRRLSSLELVYRLAPALVRSGWLRVPETDAGGPADVTMSDFRLLRYGGWFHAVAHYGERYWVSFTYVGLHATERALRRKRAHRFWGLDAYSSDHDAHERGADRVFYGDPTYDAVPSAQVILAADSWAAHVLRRQCREPLRFAKPNRQPRDSPSTTRCCRCWSPTPKPSKPVGSLATPPSGGNATPTPCHCTAAEHRGCDESPTSGGVSSAQQISASNPRSDSEHRLQAAARSIDGSTSTAHKSAWSGSASTAPTFTLRDLVRHAMSRVDAAASEARNQETAGWGGIGSSQSPTSTPPTRRVDAKTTTALEVTQTIHASRVPCLLVDVWLGEVAGLGRNRLRDLTALPVTRWPTREIAAPVASSVAFEIP